MNLRQIFLLASLMLIAATNINAQEKDALPIPAAAESTAFLAKNKSAKGVMVTSSGLQYKIIKKGMGVIPAATDRVTLNYVVSFVNGKPYAKTDGWEHHIDKALPGMQEALVMMPVGSEWILYLPANLAFGEAGYENIPAGTGMICKLELVNSSK